jgi:hypothetical protein
MHAQDDRVFLLAACQFRLALTRARHDLACLAMRHRVFVTPVNLRGSGALPVAQLSAR